MRNLFFAVITPVFLVSSAFGGEYVIWDDRPASDGKCWQSEWFPVGNGRLGAMIRGGIAESRLQFNVDSLWTGGKNISGAVDDATSGKTYEPMGKYQAFGDLRVLFDIVAESRAKGYRRSLDISKALWTEEFTFDGAKFIRTAMASAPDDVIGMEFVSERPVNGRAFLVGAHGEGVGLTEPLAAGHVDVEKVGLAVPGELAALPVEDEAGVVHPAVLQLRDGAAHHIDAGLGCGGGEHLPCRAAGLLAVGAEAAVLVGAAEHLRQDGHVRTAARNGAGEVVLPVGGDGELDEGELHGAASF